jgi:hypothetical protein
MVSESVFDEFFLGTKTPEGVDSVVSQEDLGGIPEVSNNERYRVRQILADHPTEDDAAIRALYGA